MNIFSYSDYRDYTKDYYHQKKSLNPTYSMSILAGKIGISKMAIKYLIDKKRHISDKKIPLLIKALDFLSPIQAKYFSTLVRFNKSDTTENKDYYFKKMQAIQGSPLKDHILSHKDAGLFQDWYYPVILEMSYLRQFKKDPEWIKKHMLFNISLEEIRDAVAFLDKHEFIKASSETWGKKVIVPESMRSHLYKRFCQRQLLIAKDAMNLLPIDERESSSLTISVDDAAFLKAKNLLKNLRIQLHEALANKRKGNRVIQLTTQLCTVVKLEGEKK